MSCSMASMKLTAFYLLATFLISLGVNGQAPLPRLSLDFKNAPLKTVLDTIENRVHFAAFGPSTWSKFAKNVTISVENKPLDKILDLCFKDQPLTYQLIGNTISITMKSKPAYSIGGKLINARREPISGATIQIKGTRTFVQSNENGEFSVPIESTMATLVIGSINYERIELTLGAGRDTVMELQDRVIALNGVTVLHTGYQNIPRERATGSFALIDYNLVNRSTSPNILDRLDGITPSLLFTKNPVFGTNQSSFSIRGRSTIFANPEPLIVVDNFPYTGDIYNINPDDVESITVLKDAAAASIWGAYSGNGVVVITTKKGKFNQAPKVCVNTNLTFGARPDLYYRPILSSFDYVGIEDSLFARGFYDPLVADMSHPALSPVTELLLARRNGTVSPSEASNELNIFRGQDTRQDLGHYFYRHSLTQQYSVNLSGGGANNQYYFSAGFENDRSNLVRNQYHRVTLAGNSTYILIPKKLEFSSGFNYAASNTANNNTSRIIVWNYPYVQLADGKGNALAVPNQYRQSFIDTVGGGQLLDWQYRPLDELRNADNNTKLSDYRINLSMKYNMLKDLSANLYYQYWKASSDLQDFHGIQTYYTRDLINSFTELNSGITYPVPPGGILDEIDSSYQANNVRAQINFDHYFDPDQSFTGIAGVEVRDIEGRIKTTRLYGYDKDLNSSKPVNYVKSYPLYLFPNGNQQQIPYLDHDLTTSDRYLSYYFNGSYHLLGRYILSASARKDESNIFGVKANQKGVPLWSAGAAWELSRESFYHADGWLPYLRLRLTDGYNGNVDKTVSAYTTALINSYNSTYGAPTASIVNPPNPNLQWEKIHIINGGIDFAMQNGSVDGSMEYYVKYGEDLIGPTLIDPTTGNTQFTGNTAKMKTQGVDINIRTSKVFGPVRWSTALLFSYSHDIVTHYNIRQSTIEDYFNPGFFNPLEGRPLYSVYALKWMGLDPRSGDPQGWYNGHISKDYSLIAASTDFNSLKYAGPSHPPYFGSLRNTLEWRKLALSFNIVYKFGYVFRRTSIDYFDLFSGASPGHPDFDKRWIKPGDEKFTDVPSLDFSVNDASRDRFYANSQALIEKGDHLRLQDIRISYDLGSCVRTKFPLRSAQIYLYASNIGILWRANHQGIDPDAVSLGNMINYPNPRTLTMGVKFAL
ncbi:MAG: SusC/RagA family TonB-linked outer membrane protein [Bacteroidota bacterium]|nr:SusC/RagA family TonB-linked outer membrane protein [Bacteroidota bacterium]